MPTVHRAYRAVLAALTLGALSLVIPGVALAGSPAFLVADTTHATDVRSWPGGPVTQRLDGSTPLGSPRSLWVIDRDRKSRWGRVLLPTKPNGSTGWIDLRSVTVRRTNVWVIADLGARRVTLMRGSRPVASFPSAIGASESPTPTGRFSVTDLVATGNPSGPFGWFAFGLSGHQPDLPTSWTGGDQLAIHGTNSPSSIGHAASAGCLRVAAGALSRLRDAVRLGTPVMIVRTAKAARRLARRASITSSHAREPVRAAPPASPAPVIIVELAPEAASAMEQEPLARPAGSDGQPAERARKAGPLLAVGVLPLINAPKLPHRPAVHCLSGARDGARAPPRRARAPTSLS